MTPSQRAVEAAARAAAKARGDDFNQIPKDKAEWTEQRGHFGGRFRDVNEPFQSEYIEMAEACLTAALAVDGVALVPKEPTVVMIHAGHHQIDWCRNDQATHLPEHPSQTDNGVGTTCKQDICDAWSAMITAASEGEERK